METKVVEIMKNVFNTENISSNTDQMNCDKWDSLHHLNLIVELENEFDVEFEPEEIAEMKSFGKVIEVIKSKMD